MPINLGSGAALAYANGDIQGAAGVTVTGQTAITADLTTKTDGGGQVDIDIGDNDKQTMNYGWASAGLSIDPQANIKTGAITIDAEADLLSRQAGPHSGGSRAFLNVECGGGDIDRHRRPAAGRDRRCSSTRGQRQTSRGICAERTSSMVRRGEALSNAHGAGQARWHARRQNAKALATLNVNADTGKITGKSVTVTADAHMLGVGLAHSGGARAILNVNAADGAVAIGGPLVVTGDVVSKGNGGNVSGTASAVIHGKDGVTLGNATVRGTASGLGENAKALAALKIKAETGNITGKSLSVAANAVHLGTGGQGVVTAKALSSLDAVTGNVTITGDQTPGARQRAPCHLSCHGKRRYRSPRRAQSGSHRGRAARPGRGAGILRPGSRQCRSADRRHGRQRHLPRRQRDGARGSHRLP